MKADNLILTALRDNGTRLPQTQAKVLTDVIAAIKLDRNEIKRQITKAIASEATKTILNRDAESEAYRSALYKAKEIVETIFNEIK